MSSYPTIYIDPAEAMNLIQNRIVWIDRILKSHEDFLNKQHEEAEAFNQKQAEDYNKLDMMSRPTFGQVSKISILTYLKNYNRHDRVTIEQLKSAVGYYPTNIGMVNQISALRCGVWYDNVLDVMKIGDMSGLTERQTNYHIYDVLLADYDKRLRRNALYE